MQANDLVGEQTPVYQVCHEVFGSFSGPRLGTKYTVRTKL